MMYGNKELPMLTKQFSHKRSINVEYYVTKAEFEKLRKSGLSVREICKLTGFPSTEKTFNKYIDKLGWEVGEVVRGKNAKLSVNEDFFKTWSRNNAWVYGWLLTDGSIQEKTGHVALCLKTHDKDVLIKIKEVIEFTGKIYDRVSKEGKQTSTLRVCRKSICEDIFALGMARENKTFNTAMPDIPDEYFWDFLRGVVEGDGGIYHRTGNTDALAINISGATKQFMVDLQSALGKIGISTRLNTRKANSSSGNVAEVYTLETKSNADSLRMCYFMYANTTDANRLRRKFNVYQNYVATYYDKVKRRSTDCIELVELARQTIPECSDFFNAQLTHKEAI